MGLPEEEIVWPGSAATRMRRCPAGTAPHWSRGGWVITTMSPSWTSCQLKNAFCTRIRSFTASVGTMDADGTQKISPAYVRSRTDSSAATRSVMTVSVSPRRHRRRCGPVPAGSVLAGSVLAGSVLAGSVLAGSVLAGSVLAGSVLAGSVLAGSVLAGPRSAGAGMRGSLDAQLRVACGGNSVRNLPGQEGATRGELVRGAGGGARGRGLDLRGDRAGRRLGRACRLGRCGLSYQCRREAE